MHALAQKVTLAPCRGFYDERAATEPLAASVKCFWTHRMPDGTPSRFAVVPDGCADIIWSAEGLAVAGPDRVAAFPSLAPGTTIFGARFRIGAAASWLRTPLSEITARRCPSMHSGGERPARSTRK